VLGTSVCWIVQAEHLRSVPGIFGVVDGGVAEGLWAYEGGQSSVGDTFQWFIDRNLPESYRAEARRRGISEFQLLGERASRQGIGENGLLALDWFNGNRSILVDAELTGMIMGQTLQTRPEDQYRALMESCVFGARVIIENFESHGVPVDEIRAAGGLLKEPFLMQMYADITRRPISVATVAQAGALGSAIFAAVAAGAYPTVVAAADAMGGVRERAYVPREEASRRYDRLWELYRHLYFLMGRENDVMHQLKGLQREALSESRAQAAPAGTER
jgi:L-ribulokinase